MTRIHLLHSAFKPRSYQLLLFGFGAGSVSYYFFPSPKPSQPSHLNSEFFTPYTLISKTPVSSTSSIFTLKPQNHEDGKNSEILNQAFAKGVWSVQFKQPQLQIARNYTPLPPYPWTEDGEFDVLIRREEGGEVSNYLHDLPVRSTISVRGPFSELDISHHSVSEIIFLAGGTGIAPALQVAYHISGHENKPRMSILWANRRREECIGAGDGPQYKWWTLSPFFGFARHVPSKPGEVVKMLQGFETHNGVKTRYFVDEDGSFITPRDVERLLRPTQVEGEKLVLVSGPEGFVEYWAGRKEWVGGREVQGVLDGQLAKMNLKGWKVIKL